jgi:hypothetical protein
MAFKIPLAGSDLLAISDIGHGIGLTAASNTQNSPPPGTLSIGNHALGVDAGFETGQQSQPGTGAPAPVNVDAMDDIGHGRIESFDIHALGNTLGAAFQPGDSAYQANPTQGSLLDGDVANGFDGNNIENVHVLTVIHGLDAVATWDNSADTNANPTPVDVISPLIHGDTLAGFGGGDLHDVTIGGHSLFHDLFH